MALPQQLDFLKSVSFWCLTIIAVLGVMQQQGILSAEVVQLLDIILGSIVGVRAKNQIAGAISSAK